MSVTFGEVSPAAVDRVNVLAPGGGTGCAHEVYAVKIDVLILRMINFMVSEGGKIFLAAHPPQSESFVRAANRLQEFAQSPQNHYSPEWR